MSKPLVMASIRQAWPVWQRIFLLIVIFIALKSLYTYLPLFSLSIEMGLTGVILAAAVFLFLIALYRANGVWCDQEVTWHQALQRTIQHILKVYLACVCILCLFAIIFFVGRWLIFSVLALTGMPAAVGLIFFVGIPLILVLVYSYLTIPLLALQELSLWQAFSQSLLLTQAHFLMMVLLYIEIIILVVAAATHTRHGVWLLHHHLMELFDLIVFSLILPLFINQTLLLLYPKLLNETVE
jgi:hypothetical protein